MCWLVLFKNCFSCCWITTIVEKCFKTLLVLYVHCYTIFKKGLKIRHHTRLVKYQHLLYTYWEILTKKLCRKTYFRTQISSSQSEERTMVFTREKNDTSNLNSERCFSACEKNDTSNQKPQRCVSFAPKFPPFIAACGTASHTFNEKSFTQRASVVLFVGATLPFI